MREIHHSRSFLANRFLRACAREQGSMEEAHLQFAGVIGNGDGKEAGVLIVHMDEVKAAIALEGGKGRGGASLLSPRSRVGVRQQCPPCDTPFCDTP
jgi:hypothetical protein